MRDRFNRDFGRLDDHFKQLHNPPRYPVTYSPKLQRLTSGVQGAIMESLEYAGS